MRLFAPLLPSCQPAHYLAAQPRLAYPARAEPQGSAVWGIVCALTMALAGSDLQA